MDFYDNFMKNYSYNELCKIEIEKGQDMPHDEYVALIDAIAMKFELIHG